MKDLNLAVIRLAHPLAFSGFLNHIGAPVAGYFRRQGLPVLCEDPNAFVSLHRAWKLFGDAAAREDQMLGWYVGKYVGDQNMNAGVLKKLEGAPTLYRALIKLVQIISAEASHLQLGIRKCPTGILFFTHYAGMSEETGYHASQAYQLEIYIDLIKHFAGRDWKPREVGIEASEIPALLQNQFPNCRIHINQPFGYVHVPSTCLHMELRQAHSKTNMESHLIDPRGLSDAQILRLLLVPYLSQGYPTMRFSASLMETSKRTLARRLAACGTSYQTLVDEVRFSQARKLLSNTDAPIYDVAGSVGFSNQGHFSRMFGRVGGLGPRQYRRLEQGSESMDQIDAGSPRKACAV
jgi:AraC-like DNA-binding protein